MLEFLTQHTTVLSNPLVHVYSVMSVVSFVFSFVPIALYGKAYFYTPHPVSIIMGAFGFSCLLGFGLQIFFLMSDFSVFSDIAGFLSTLPVLATLGVLIYLTIKINKPSESRQSLQQVANQKQNWVILNTVQHVIQHAHTIVYMDKNKTFCSGNIDKIIHFMILEKLSYFSTTVDIPQEYHHPHVLEQISWEVCFPRIKGLFLDLKDIQTPKQWKQSLTLLFQKCETYTVSASYSSRLFLNRRQIPQNDDLKQQLLAVKQRILDEEIIQVQTGVDFEILCRNILMALGWKAEMTKTTGDFGADLIAEKGDLKILIQCKYYQKNVSLSAVQEIYTALSLYKVKYAAVLTNIGYTKSAITLAKANQVLLLTLDNLYMINNLSYKNADNEHRLAVGDS